MTIQADETMHFSVLNKLVRESADTEIAIRGCIGQRYIATGNADKKIEIYGTPGNALGAYLNGGEIAVFGNAQDATGDTMNGGKIVIHGNAGDATGYAMRGGKIFVEGNTGYRAGIHMKAYKDCKPILVVGGRAGSFLGEYQAGGIIVVLGQNTDGLPVVHNFCGTGMHGGVMYLRCDELPHKLPKQVRAERVCGASVQELKAVIEEYCSYFPAFNADTLSSGNFFMLTPDKENPYKQMYTDN